jgi:hypothetical protein
MMTRMKKAKRMMTRKTTSLQSSENQTNVDNRRRRHRDLGLVPTRPISFTETFSVRTQTVVLIGRLAIANMPDSLA